MLSVFPRPIPGESVHGYFNRLAMENSLSPHKLYQGIYGKQVYDFGRIRKEDFCRLTQHTPEDMDNLWLTYEDAYYILKDVVLPKSHIVNRTRWCPICWRDNQIMQCIWQIGWIPICPTHEVLLLDQCTKCEGDITYARHSAHCRKCHELVENMTSNPGPTEVLASQMRSMAAVFEPTEPRHYARNPVVEIVSRLLSQEEVIRRSSKDDHRAAPREHYWLSVAETIQRYQSVLAARA